MLILVAAGLALWGCDRDEADEDDEPVAIEELDDGLPPEGPFEGAHDRSVPVEPDEFATKLTDSFCLAYDHCRNQHIQAALFQTIGVSAGMVAADQGDHQAAAEIRSVMEDLENAEQPIATRDQCQTVFGFTFADGGLDATSLSEAVQSQRVTYDADAAGECMAQFGEPFDLCLEFHQIVDVVDLEQATAAVLAHQEDLVGHFESCNDAFEGQQEEGQECRFDYECAAGGCQKEQGDDIGACRKSYMGDDLGPMMPGPQQAPDAPPAPGVPQPPGAAPGEQPTTVPINPGPTDD